MQSSWLIVVFASVTLTENAESIVFDFTRVRVVYDQQSVIVNASRPTDASIDA